MHKDYFVSLVRSLYGYYVWFSAESEEIVRYHCAKYYGRMWCSVYEDRNDIEKKGGKIINSDSPCILESSDWE